MALSIAECFYSIFTAIFQPLSIWPRPLKLASASASSILPRSTSLQTTLTSPPSACCRYALLALTATVHQTEQVFVCYRTTTRYAALRACVYRTDAHSSRLNSVLRAASTAISHARLSIECTQN